MLGGTAAVRAKAAAAAAVAGFGHSGWLEVQMRFEECRQLTHIDTLGSGIGQLQGLKTLGLDFKACTAIAQIESLATGVVESTYNWRAVPFQETTTKCHSPSARLLGSVPD